ncbi:MAG TPA: cation transporting ATPase C-terminal domain-containing protein [Ilumatobacteraceae bacterium]|nr:cation transporting ATPase C-terminal domain-containing protein [Ilumatobacteraceae bacterium]
MFNCRSEETSVFRTNLFRNKLLFAGVTISLAIHVGATYFPPTQNLLSLERRSS